MTDTKQKFPSCLDYYTCHDQNTALNSLGMTLGQLLSKNWDRNKGKYWEMSVIHDVARTE